MVAGGGRGDGWASGETRREAEWELWTCRWWTEVGKGRNWGSFGVEELAGKRGISGSGFLQERRNSNGLLAMKFGIESQHGECRSGVGVKVGWNQKLGEFRDDGVSRGRRDGGGRDVRSAVGITNRSVWEFRKGGAGEGIGEIDRERREDGWGCRKVSGRSLGRFSGETGRWPEGGGDAGERWSGRRSWRRGLPEACRRLAGDGGGDGGGDDGGAAIRRRRRRQRRRLEDSGVAMIVEKNQWPGQGVAAAVAAAAARRRAAAAAAATTAIGLLPRPSLSSHLRGRTLLSFFK